MHFKCERKNIAIILADEYDTKGNYSCGIRFSGNFKNMCKDTTESR